MKRNIAAASIALLSVAASSPRALAPATGGFWQVSQDARGGHSQNLCIADPALLGQWEHRRQRCERTILSDNEGKTVLSYVCGNGGFGRSEITVLTPRTLRVATQGISASGPFNYTIHARRVGNCPVR